MRITIFSMLDSVPWGGSEVLWSRVAMAAVDAGHEVQVCVREFTPVPTPIASLASRGVRIVKRQSSQWRQLAGPFAKKLANVSIDANKPFVNEITDFQPDVILVSNAATIECFYYTPLYELLISTRAKIFLLSQFNHESGPPIPPAIAERILTLSKKWQRFYFVARRNLEVFERRLGVSLPATRIINNSVGLSNLEVAPWPSQETLSLACVARYEVSFKGQDILLQTLADNELKAYKFRVDFFGSGPDREHLQRLIKSYGLEDRVTLKGHADDIDKLWESYHGLVLPSIAEGCPLSLLEAMVKGRAAVVTDVGGSADWIVEGKTGFVAAAANKKSLKQAVLNFVSLPLDKIKTMGSAAHEHAMRSLDLHPEQTILRDAEETASLTASNTRS
jgi:glycosyltransferase involved in cell wall biosynthesis